MLDGGRCGWAVGWKAVDTETTRSGSETGSEAGECRFIEAAAAARSLPVCTCDYWTMYRRVDLARLTCT